MHSILPTFLYLLQSHHWTVFTVKSLYRVVLTCGVYHDVTGRTTGRHSRYTTTTTTRIFSQCATNTGRRIVSTSYRKYVYPYS